MKNLLNADDGFMRLAKTLRIKIVKAATFINCAPKTPSAGWENSYILHKYFAGVRNRLSIYP
jgi:hypothetical protein